jgi:hypothetical protein
MKPLLYAYIANILILVPVAMGSLFGWLPIDDGRFSKSSGWRTITGSLWTALLVCSIAGLFHPLTMAPILLLQVIYKSVWLLVYVAPRLGSPVSRKEIPPGITLFFLLIALLYPFLIPWNSLWGGR